MVTRSALYRVVPVVVVMVSFVASQSSTPTARASASCTFKKISCRAQKITSCDEGERCVDVRPSVSDPSKCEYVCQPAVTRMVPIRMNSSQPHAPNVTNNATNDVTSNVTNDATNNVSNDPAFCNKNFVCQNGGLCDIEFKASGRGGASCQCPPNTRGIFCQTFCFRQCQNNGTCVVEHGEELCSCKVNFSGELCEKSLHQTTSPGPYSKATENSTYRLFSVLLGLCAAFLFVLPKYTNI